MGNFLSMEPRAYFYFGSITVAAQLSTLLRDWLSLYIRRHDKNIFRFIQEQKRAQLPLTPHR